MAQAPTPATIGTTIAIGATSMFAFRVCQALVQKGILTKEEAANIMVSTANDIRSGSEDDEKAAAGEGIARTFEKLAEWLIR